MTDDSIKENATVREFVETAERFCSLIERFADLSAYELARHSGDLLPLLYRLGLLLPDLTPNNAVTIKGSVPSDKRAEICREVGAKFGKLNFYREVFDAYENQEDEPVIGTIGDDISDIYSELKDGLAIYPPSPLEAVWYWKFGFINHWGHHLVSVLKPIHHLFSNYLITESKTDSAGNGT